MKGKRLLVMCPPPRSSLQSCSSHCKGDQMRCGHDLDMNSLLISKGQHGLVVSPKLEETGTPQSALSSRLILGTQLSQCFIFSVPQFTCL